VLEKIEFISYLRIAIFLSFIEFNFKVLKGLLSPDSIVAKYAALSKRFRKEVTRILMKGECLVSQYNLFYKCKKLLAGSPVFGERQ